MKELPLTQGYVALVDDEDYEELSQYRWGILRKPHTVYAKRWDSGRAILMHRAIMNAPADMQVDHQDGDGLNNTRANLRLATPHQNNGNSRKRRDGRTSRFKGVCWDKHHGKWLAYIKNQGKRFNLGRFDAEEEAARAYDTAALSQWGEFAKLNFPDDAQAA